MTRTGKTYIIQTNDGPENDNVFLTWDTDDGFYTTVDSIDEISDYDFHDTIEGAEARAMDANSGTFGGWNWAPMKIMELTNFKESYDGNEEPKLMEVKTITFDK